MKRLTLLVLIGWMIISAQSLFAVPAVPWPVEKEQPDGTLITVYLRGDEKVRWMESMDGYTLLYDNQKNIVYAQLDESGNLVPSDVLYTPQIAKTLQEEQFIATLDKRLVYSEAQVNTFLQVWNVEESQTKKSRSESSVIGERHALCILMNFTNKSMVHTIEEFDNLMNQIGYSVGRAKGSVRDFYRENSYGQLDFTVTVVGPFEAPNSTSYYGANEYRYFEFAEVAMRAADEEVDYQMYANENGELETVHILFAGYGDEAINNGRQIWSHKAQLLTPIYLDDVRCSVYSCSPELTGSYGTEITSVGVVCHELCHVFGSDDYYDINYGTGGQYDATGEWDLMASGSWNDEGNCPSHINMFQKILYGWVTPIELDEESVSIVDMPNSAENAVAYVIKPYTDNEQYILENRQKVGFDSAVPGKGLLIYHIHDSASEGHIRNTTHPQQVYVVSASSTYAIPIANSTSYGNINSKNAPFASAESRNEFSVVSTPAMFRWFGGVGTRDGVLYKPLTNITQSNGLVSFKFIDGVEERYCPQVRDFSVSVLGSEAVLTWEKPLIAGNEDIEYTYKLYQNGTLLVEDFTETTYSVSLEEYGYYNYGIIASCEGLEYESWPVYRNIDYEICELEAGALTIEVEENLITISWEEALDAISYNLYRDDQILLEETTDTRFEESLEESGTYVYSLVAIGENCTSQPVSETLEFTYVPTDINHVDYTKLIKVYPTVTDRTIKVETPFEAVIKINDITGRTLSTYTSADNLTIELDYLPGIYFVTVEVQNQVSSYKVILK